MKIKNVLLKPKVGVGEWGGVWVGLSNIYQTKILVIQKAYFQLSASVILETAKSASCVLSGNLRVKT